MLLVGWVECRVGKKRGHGKGSRRIHPISSLRTELGKVDLTLSPCQTRKPLELRCHHCSQVGCRYACSTCSPQNKVVPGLGRGGVGWGTWRANASRCGLAMLELSWVDAGMGSLVGGQGVDSRDTSAASFRQTRPFLWIAVSFTYVCMYTCTRVPDPLRHYFLFFLSFLCLHDVAALPRRPSRELRCLYAICGVAGAWRSGVQDAVRLGIARSFVMFRV